MDVRDCLHELQRRREAEKWAERMPTSIEVSAGFIDALERTARSGFLSFEKNNGWFFCGIPVIEAGA